MVTSPGLFLVLTFFVTCVEMQEPNFSSYWVVAVDEATDPRKVAEEMQFEYKGKVLDDQPLHRFRLLDHHTRSRRMAQHHTERLMSHPQIRSANQEVILHRGKRDFIDPYDVGENNADAEWIMRAKRFEEKRNNELIIEKERKRREEIDDMKHLFNDPFWSKQWYLHDIRSDSLQPKVDLHVYPVWKRGITGKGVVITVIDDGLQWTHPDLKTNYLPEASYDFNGDKGNNPMPRETRNNINKHGTRCAGEISMVANNSICGVGIAFNSKIGGIRILDGIVTDSVEASSLSFGLDTIDIYSASWGPTDNGQSMEGPGVLASAALERGISKGRKGRGAIYIWAGGNGGIFHDDCSCDGYASSVYTIAISSVTSNQLSPSYIELCPAIMATTFSGSRGGTEKVVGTDLHGKCTDQHGGTSASAPLAAGIMALALEANPDLTWRDAQHLIAWTSEVQPLLGNPGWLRNGAGFYVNVRFGFGLMNADALVQLADKSTWKSVPEKHICRQSRLIRLQKIDRKGESNPLTKRMSNRRLYSGQKIAGSLMSDGCRGKENEVNFLEHVQLNLTMSYSRRGSLSIALISPAGMKTQILKRRSRDTSQGNWSWTFTSVHNWGESPRGVWKIEIEDHSDIKRNRGILRGFEMIFHGTKEMPHHVKQTMSNKRHYNMNYNSVKNVRSDFPEIKEPEIKASNHHVFRPIFGGLQRQRPYPEELDEFIRLASNRRLPDLQYINHLGEEDEDR